MRRWNRDVFLAVLAVNIGMSFSTTAPHPDLLVRLLSGLVAGLIVGFGCGWLFRVPQP